MVNKSVSLIVSELKIRKQLSLLLLFFKDEIMFL